MQINIVTDEPEGNDFSKGTFLLYFHEMEGLTSTAKNNRFAENIMLNLLQKLSLVNMAKTHIIAMKKCFEAFHGPAERRCYNQNVLQTPNLPDRRNVLQNTRGGKKDELE